jgi:hypothetical protein
VGRKVLNSYQGLAPETFFRQRLYLPVDRSGISAVGIDCLDQAAHARLLITVGKLHVGKEPQ